MEQERDADRAMFSLNEQDAAEVETRIASGDPFAGEPDLYITHWLVANSDVQIDEHGVSQVTADLRARWRSAQAAGAKPLRQGVGGPTDSRLGLMGAVTVEHLALREPLSEAGTLALLDLVLDDAPGEWFDRVVTTLAENPTLPPECRGALVIAARRTELSGYHPHMMGPDYAWQLSRVPHIIASHPAPMTAELFETLLDGRVDADLRETLLGRPDLTDEQRFAVAANPPAPGDDVTTP